MNKIKIGIATVGSLILLGGISSGAYATYRYFNKESDQIIDEVDDVEKEEMTLYGETFEVISINEEIIDDVKSGKVSTLYDPYATFVDDNLFNGITTLESVYLPNAKYIGKNSFYNCTNLSEVSLPNALLIDSSAFYYNIKLKNVVASTLKEIGDYAFYRNTSLLSVTAPECEKIGEYAFCRDSALKVYDFTSVKEIGAYAFSGYKYSAISSSSSINIVMNLTTAKFPNCEIIGDYAFYNNTTLSSYDLASVKEIGISAFELCAIDDIVLGNVLKIHDNAFKSNPVVSVDLPLCEYVGNYVFYYSNSSVLSYFKAPVLKELGSYNFYMSPIETVDLPELVKAGDYCFWKCSATTYKLPKLEEAGNYCFYVTENLLFDLPELVKAGDYCFAGFSSELQNCLEYDLPKLEEAGGYCFAYQNCLSLSLPNLKKVGTFCFNGSRNITNIDLPKLENSSDYCFDNLGVKSLVLPSLVTSYRFRNMPNLEILELDNLIGFQSTYLVENCPNIKIVRLKKFVNNQYNNSNYFFDSTSSLSIEEIYFDSYEKMRSNTSVESNQILLGSSNNKFDSLIYIYAPKFKTFHTNFFNANSSTTYPSLKAVITYYIGVSSYISSDVYCAGYNLPSLYYNNLTNSNFINTVFLGDKLINSYNINKTHAISPVRIENIYLPDKYFDNYNISNDFTTAEKEKFKNLTELKLIDETLYNWLSQYII